MPVNRNALIRYRTIDNCLRHKYKKHTLDDLVEACSEALYEYEGIEKGVSRRTVQMDLQMMRSEKLGYNAPIVVLEKKYYTYEDPDYSITNIPLTEQDLGKLTEVVEILRQFKGFSHFHELSGMVQRLENKIYAARTNQEPIIDFEKNENLKGLEHIDMIYQAIIQKQALELSYQSFKARQANTFTFHAYYLKEYRNRWFVIGIKKRNMPILNLALDRIIAIRRSSQTYVPKDNFNINEYLHDVVGVSVSQNVEAEEVHLFADRETAPYIETKPIHHSQQVIEQLTHGTIFSLRVQLNFELEREILGFGDRVKVIKPERLKRRIKEIFSHALDLYQSEFNSASLSSHIQKLAYKGFSVLQHVYTQREIQQMRGLIQGYFKEHNQPERYAIRELLQEVPALAQLIFNDNLRHILDRIQPGSFVSKAIFLDKTPEKNWAVQWHQDIIIHVDKQEPLEGYTAWTKKRTGYGVCPPERILAQITTIRIHLDATDESNGVLKVIPGSHHHLLSSEEIQTLANNSIPVMCDVLAGGIHIMKPLLLHASNKATSNKPRRVLHLEFCATKLDGNLAWQEFFDYRNGVPGASKRS